MRKKDNNSHCGRIGDEFQPSGSIVSNEIIRSSDVLTVVIISTWPRMTASPTCCFPTWLECCMSVLQTKSNVVICCFNRLVCCFWAPDLIHTHIGWKYRKSPAVPLGWCFCFIVTDPVNTALLMCAALSVFVWQKQAIRVTLSKPISFCLRVNSEKNSCHGWYSEVLDALTSVLSSSSSPSIPSVSVLSLQKSVKEGILLKQTSSFQRWKRRYFKLRGRTLYYAKDCKVQNCVIVLPP